MKLTYIKTGDYLVPEIEANKQPEISLTKFGRLRKTYLKNYQQGIYAGMLLTGTLIEHLLEIQEQAESRLEVLMEQTMKSEGVTESLKEKDQMIWVSKMNNIQQAAEEIILQEIIYV